MQQKIFFSTTGVIFAIIAVLHFLRLAFALEAMVGGWGVPMWVSGLAVLVAIYLSWQSFKLRKGLDKQTPPPSSN